MKRRIRPSRLHDWMQCEAMALHRENNRRPMPALPAAMWVGSLAHSILLEDDEPVRHESLGLDNITPTVKAGRAQARLIAREARRTLDLHCQDIRLAETEVDSRLVVGRLDMVLLDRLDGAQTIVDLKTGGQYPHGAMTQVGAYMEAVMDGEGIDPRDLREWRVGVLWVPRSPLDRPLEGRFETRPAEDVYRATLPVLERAQSVQTGVQEARRTPGMHCMRCEIRNSCPVR